ncbi:MAG: hypothetical protein LBT02_03110, partial [Rickettsiales bacterium]|nr:hypothetical protein [Rickettsiales bacterium]
HHFNETDKNPIANLKFDNNKWLALPLKINNVIIFVFFHINFIANGISLANIFEIADKTEYENKIPDAILVLGGEDGEEKAITNFYQDKKNNIIIGYFNNNEDFDYFSYVKKMLMIIFSIKNLQNDKLAVKGLLLNILLKNGKTFNLLWVGDTYSGKFYLEEKLTALLKNEVKRIKIIFNDIGYLGYKDTELRAFGTETGTFLKIKALGNENNYYSDLKKTIERSIFLSAASENNDNDVRVVTPMNSFWNVNIGWKIDYMILITNEVSNGKLMTGNNLTLFNDVYTAKKTFTEVRKSVAYNKKERNEDSFFFNEYGNDNDRRKKMENLADRIFEDAFKTGVLMGKVTLKPNKDSPEIIAAKNITDLILKQ